jgi:hypothetical protein
MKEKELQALRTLCEKANSGPWHFHNDGLIWAEFDRDKGACSTVGSGEGIVGKMYEKDDAAFVAAARDAVPKLIAEVERLNGLLTCQRTTI